jgi:cytochrome oxidase Cu insertion factor (SCO1/SenC/PrrC family)
MGNAMRLTTFGSNLARLLGLLLAGLLAVTAQASESWGSNYFPNPVLYTQDGKRVRFFDDLIKDRVVAINFIYTTCANACPLETARMREVQRLLGERMGRDVFFYSISIDPRNDSPRVLKQYAETFGIGPGWTFLTGRESDILALRKALGVFSDNEDPNPVDHNLNLVVGNQATGIWRKASPYENPHVLAELIGNQLHNWKQATTLLPESYANAPVRLAESSRGEQLFRSRCVSCHTTGAPPDSLAAKQSIGPDLAGVTVRRQRDWLFRWIQAPDRMLADRDPVALALYESYRRVAMPNMQLNDLEVNSLIDYLRDEVGEQGRHRAQE